MDNSTGDNGRPPMAAMDTELGHESEMAEMIRLAVAQIEMALLEGDESLDTLSQFFSSMFAGVDNISKDISRLDKEADLVSLKSSMLEHCDSIRSRMNTVIIAFQFYDRLSQRLGHVSGSLDSLAGLFDLPQHLSYPNALKELRERVRKEYSLEEERILFEALQDGCSVQEALRRCADRRNTKGAGCDVELF
jgi:hypothetical protein